jgi:glutamine amidotransferase-like uncharacterized protein
MTNNTAYVYCDKGTSILSIVGILELFKISNINAKLITANELINTSWEKNASIFAIPGGRDLPYQEKLKGMGNDKITSFVKNGGIYLGICAGAYYACNDIEFDKNGDLEICEKRNLCFFPNTAVGPIFGPNTYKYNSHESAHLLEINLMNNQSHHFYYNGGCFFKNAEIASNTQILARYKDNDEAAIIKCSYGKGFAYLSGVHFEYSTFPCVQG